MMPLLAASEKGIGQTESPYESEVEMWWVWTSKLLNQTLLESKTLEGDSPVEEVDTLSHKKSRASWIRCLNMGELTPNPK